MTVENCAPAGATAAAGDVARASLTLPAVTSAGAAGLDAGAALAQPGEQAPDEKHHDTALELMLMAVSTILAFAGIGLATLIWLQRPEIAARMSDRFPGLHRLLLNKYYVDELYDATVVQPIKVVSEDGLWRGMDARVVDGAVNGTGQVVAGMSAVLRLTQTGSVKSYAAATFFGAVLVLAYYIWR